ncbi:hypothetical protein FHR99_001974 [Litorivivens lipolytica]|uniref:Energy transducer TonB n=1 Tax=Litorivivens lipolytica TaxID=1524264 RepID=A0A7W4W592_9GAMM|nr:hypothetical protein [Litorivivens lipolytica]MBB3047708.1 hypothetical protein [Litorivivens lipolytica]
MFEALPEAKRLAYLQAMGVESFFPRFRLPGAPEPRLCDTLPTADEMTAFAEPQSESVEPPRPERAPREAPEAARNLLRDLVEKPASPETRKPTAAATPAVPKAEKLQFTLRFYLVPGLVLLVDASPEQVPETALKQFAANLMLALSRRSPDWQGSIKQSLQQHLFRWPVVGNQALAQGENEAREALTAAIQANCERHSLTQVVLMGANAQRFVEADLVKAIHSEAMAHYLQTPLAKRELWAQLTAS